MVMKMAKDYFDDLMIKTLTANSAEEIDKRCAEFREHNIVRATQTHITKIDGEDVLYAYILFYLPKDGAPKPVPQIVPAMGGVIPEPIMTRIPNIVVPESEAQWASCTICASRWKWTHFRLCRNKHNGMEGLPVELRKRYAEIWNGDGNGNNGNKIADTQPQEI